MQDRTPDSSLILSGSFIPYLMFILQMITFVLLYFSWDNEGTHNSSKILKQHFLNFMQMSSTLGCWHSHPGSPCLGVGSHLSQLMTLRISTLGQSTPRPSLYLSFHHQSSPFPSSSTFPFTNPLPATWNVRWVLPSITHRSQISIFQDPCLLS